MECLAKVLSCSFRSKEVLWTINEDGVIQTPIDAAHFAQSPAASAVTVIYSTPARQQIAIFDGKANKESGKSRINMTQHLINDAFHDFDYPYGSIMDINSRGHLSEVPMRFSVSI